MFVLYTHHANRAAGNLRRPAWRFIFPARPSFSSRIPVCQSGDAGAIPAGRTNFLKKGPPMWAAKQSGPHTRREPQAILCAVSRALVISKAAPRLLAAQGTVRTTIPDYSHGGCPGQRTVTPPSPKEAGSDQWRTTTILHHFTFPDEVRQPAGLLHRSSWFKSMSGSHYFLRTRGSQRSRLIWDQEKPGATPGCPTTFYPTPDSSDR